MRVSWMRDGDTLYGTVIKGGGCHMVVEALPDRSGWDWSAWRACGDPASVSHGVAPSVIDAMAEAEACANAEAEDSR